MADIKFENDEINKEIDEMISEKKMIGAMVEIGIGDNKTIRKFQKGQVQRLSVHKKIAAKFNRTVRVSYPKLKETK